MAEFNYNNGDPVEFIIPQVYDQATIYVSVDIIPDNQIIKVGGSTFLYCLNIANLAVIFKDHPIGLSREVYNKELEVNVDTTKFRIVNSSTPAADVPITCILSIKAGNQSIQTFSIDDRLQCTIKSAFNFRIKFLKG